MQVTGLEPAIYRLKAGCHTAWLHLHKAPCRSRTSHKQICSLFPRRMVRCLLCMPLEPGTCRLRAGRSSIWATCTKTAYPITNKRFVWLIYQQHQEKQHGFRPVTPIHNGITITRCLQARSFCCFWQNTEFIMAAIVFLLSLNLYELIIASI